MEKISKKIISTTISLTILKSNFKKNIRIMLDEIFEKTFEEIIKQTSESYKKNNNILIQDKLKYHKRKLEFMFEDILNEMLQHLTLDTKCDLEKIEFDLEKIDECPYA